MCPAACALVARPRCARALAEAASTAHATRRRPRTRRRRAAQGVSGLDSSATRVGRSGGRASWFGNSKRTFYYEVRARVGARARARARARAVREFAPQTFSTQSVGTKSSRVLTSTYTSPGTHWYLYTVNQCDIVVYSSTVPGMKCALFESVTARPLPRKHALNGVTPCPHRKGAGWRHAASAPRPTSRRRPCRVAGSRAQPVRAPRAKRWRGRWNRQCETALWPNRATRAGSGEPASESRPDSTRPPA